MEDIESEGKTVAEAVDSALKKLGLRRDQVEVQIIQEAAAGFMGLGAKPARVRITQKHWGASPPPQAPAPRSKPRNSGAEKRSEAPSRPARSISAPAAAARRAYMEAAAKAQESRAAAQAAAAETRPAEATRPPADPQAACAKGQSLLTEILGLMGIAQPAVATSWDAAQERVILKVETPDAERLIGKDGKTLESLQFLVTLVLSRSLNASVAAQVDALGYWEKREKEILSEAQRGVEEVKATGKPFRLTPMEAPMRRLIHRNLANHPDVVTASEGEGSWRKIVIRPRKG